MDPGYEGQMHCKHIRAERIQDLMKKTFIFFLCCSTLLYGCFPLSPLTTGDWLAQGSLSEREILVTLVDGSVIKSQPHHHFYTTEPADFIYGFGKRKHRSIRGVQTEFVGKLERASIDSLKLIGAASNRYLICYLPDSTDIYLRDGDYIVVTPDQSPGLWCAGVLTADGKDSVFSGKIPNDRIESVEMTKFAPLETCFLVVGVTAVVVIIIISISSPSDKMKHLDFKW
jgi:hypothetical protein